jgi:hypothetical protein
MTDDDLDDTEPLSLLDILGHELELAPWVKVPGGYTTRPWDTPQQEGGG